MNFFTNRMNDHNAMSLPEIISRDKKMNKHKLFRIISKHELAGLSPVKLLEWKRSNSPQQSNPMRARHASIGVRIRDINSTNESRRK